MTNKTEIEELNDSYDRYTVSCHCGSVDVIARHDGHLVMHSDYVIMKKRAEAAEARIAELVTAKRAIDNLDAERVALRYELAALRGPAVVLPNPSAWSSDNTRFFSENQVKEILKAAGITVKSADGKGLE